MKTFLGGDIVAVDGAAGDGVDMVAIGVPIVTKVVAYPSNQHRQSIQLRQVDQLNERRLFHEIKAHLHYVRAMKVIVILDALVITILNFVQKVV